MSWLKLIFPLPKAEQEKAIAWFQLSGAEALVEEDASIEVYIHDHDYTNFMDVLNHYLPESTHTVQKLEDRNWNAEWESQFNPVDIAGIHIRAEFHTPKGPDDLVIMPKMAFGTGHHATTFMMIEKLSQMDLTGRHVLDYGCGTGILAVMAFRQGAGLLECIDIQEEAVENTAEHFKINAVPENNWTVKMGDLDIVEHAPYELILANINKSVLKRTPVRLFNLLKNKGLLLVSGILESDGDEIKALYKDAGFILEDCRQRGEWLCLVFYKSGEAV